MIGWIKRVHKKRDFTVFWFYNQPVYTLHSSNTLTQTLTILTAYIQTEANLELPADILPERVQFAPTIQSCTVTYHMKQMKEKATTERMCIVYEWGKELILFITD